MEETGGPLLAPQKAMPEILGPMWIKTHVGQCCREERNWMRSPLFHQQKLIWAKNPYDFNKEIFKQVEGLFFPDCQRSLHLTLPDVSDSNRPWGHKKVELRITLQNVKQDKTPTQINNRFRLIHTKCSCNLICSTTQPQGQGKEQSHQNLCPPIWNSKLRIPNNLLGDTLQCKRRENIFNT